MWSHGRHPLPFSGGEAIRWTRHPRMQRHLIDETCECKPEKFELWAGGGQRFIRKVVASTGKAYTSDAMRAADANDLWGKLLKGEAR